MFSGNPMILAAVLLPFLAAPAVWLVQRRSDLLGRALLLATCAAELVLAAVLGAQGGDSAFVWAGFAGLSASFVSNGFSVLFVLLAAFLWTCAALTGRALLPGDKNGARLSLFTLLTLGAVVGVFFAADFFTMFVFFEMMSFASFLWVVHDETAEAKHAANLYLAVSVICGMITLMGLFLLYGRLGTLRYDALAEAAAACDPAFLYTAGALAAVGFAAKAGLYPLHIWLPRAYPAAPAPQAALLSGILSKTGVIGVLLLTLHLFSGNQNWGNVLLVLSLITMLWGGVTALLSDEFKRTVACSSMSQIGFILFGVAVAGLEPGASIVLRGTVLHMVNHSVFKLILFTIAGVLTVRLGTQKLNDLRGAGRGNPVLLIAFSAAALGISGIPLFSGYVSKTLLHESVVELTARETGGLSAFYTACEWGFLIAGGLTFAYMLKLFNTLFLQKGEKRVGKLPFAVSAALLIPAALVPVFGVFTGLYDRLAARALPVLSAAHGEAVRYFSLESLSGTVSLLIGFVIYFLILRPLAYKKDGTFKTTLTWKHGLEHMLYRPLFLKALPAVLGAVSFCLAHLADGAVALLKKTVYKPLAEKGEFAYDSVLWYAVGRTLDFFRTARNRLMPWRKPNTKSYVEIAAKFGEESSMRRTMITASLSYGLLLFGLGLVIVMLYLLLM